MQLQLSHPICFLDLETTGINVSLDKIVEIAGKSVEGKSTEDVSKVLKGEPNTSVKVLIEREGVKKPFEVEITRQEIKLNSVPYYGMVSDSIGYIKNIPYMINVGKTK